MGRPDWIVVERVEVLRGAVERGGAACFFVLIKSHRFPLSPVAGFQDNPGTNRIEEMFCPWMLAVPHSVSTVINLTSVAPVMESPLSITTVVEAFSAEAKRIPATSESGILAPPKEVCISKLVLSVRVPSSRSLLIKSTVTLNGRTVGAAEATFCVDLVALAIGCALTGFAFATGLVAGFWADAVDERTAVRARAATK